VTQSGTKEILTVILLSPIHSWLIQDQKLVTSGFYKSFLKRSMFGWPQLTINLLWSNWQCQVTGGSCNHISS
jgi:hypothetical protein